MTKEERIELIKKIHERLAENDESCTLLGDEDEQQEYAGAILGIANNEPHGPRVVYLRSKIIEALVRMNGWNESDADEWYEFNTVRGIGYVNTMDNPPILVDDIF